MKSLKRKMIGILLMVLLLLTVQTAYADPNLTLQDTAVRPGSWQDNYAQILQEHASEIQAYEQYVISVTYRKECHPAELMDLTGDGIPELIFIDLITETEYGFNVGRLWIYTADETGAHCALSLQPEIDDLLYSVLYLGADGALTLHLNDVEQTWTLRLRKDQTAHYVAETVLTAQEDFSGEGPDQYFLNGKEVTRKKYQAELNAVQADQGNAICNLNVDDDGCGFARTLEEVRQELSSSGVSQAVISGKENGEGKQDSQAETRLPELTFTLGQFIPGQKFPVFSAPSDRSWRGAKGKAAITSGSEIYVAGSVGNWILIFYELDSGVNRVGYIDGTKISGDHTSGAPLSFAETPMTLVRTAEMTDDPVRQKSMIGKLKKGTVVSCLAEYQGWIYVEAKVSGKTARGFLRPADLGLE